MSESLGNFGTSNARKSGPLPPEQRLKKQQRFLKAYREIGIIKAACEIAGINRQTYYDWKANDEAFNAQLPDAKIEANESLEIMAYEQAHGIAEPALSMGKIVYEEIPDLDEKGNQKFNKNGYPMMKRGKMVMVKKYSPSVLITLLKANLPEKYKEKSAVDVTSNGKDVGQSVIVYLPHNNRDERTVEQGKGGDA